MNFILGYTLMFSVILCPKTGYNSLTTFYLRDNFPFWNELRTFAILNLLKMVYLWQFSSLIFMKNPCRPKSDSKLYFSADGNYEVRYKSNVLIYPDGEVLWIPPAIYQVGVLVKQHIIFRFYIGIFWRRF